MTPMDRIRQKRDMVQLAQEKKQPAAKAQPFPRNSVGLAMISMTVLPLIYKGMIDPSASRILAYALGTLGLGLGLFSISIGQTNKAVYDGKYVARAAPIPFKMVGAGLIAVTAAALTYYQGGGAPQAIAVLPIVAALTLITFGVDPMKNKGLDTTDGRHAYQLEKLAARVGSHLDRVRRSAKPLAVPEVMTEIRAFDDAVNALLDAVTHDPDRAGTVRKFFTVYLEGAGNASERFAAVYTADGSATAKAEYIAVLQKLTQAFSHKASEYAAAGNTQLDIEIKVLEDYLARETAAA